MKAPNVLEWLEYNCAKTLNKTAIEDPNTSITFSNLCLCAKKVATFLVNNDITNRPVVLKMDKSIDMVILLLGCVYSGNVYIPVDPSIPHKRFECLMDKLGNAYVFDPERLEERDSLEIDEVQLLNI